MSTPPTTGEQVPAGPPRPRVVIPPSPTWSPQHPGYGRALLHPHGWSWSRSVPDASLAVRRWAAFSCGG
ncbi:hypothetical protein [Kineococcus terrestris]|uniref:hypothetical protein n=1 Tax=Kineococcus terrestris TaxID=2044856 RepID=UPI0034DB5B4D